MNRKDFLQTTIPFFTAGADLSINNITDPFTKKIPPYLKPGSVIGITCPSGHIMPDEVQPCIRKMEEWGFKIILGKTVGLTDGTFAGTDEERAADLQQMLDDRDIDAIMLGRGGYGAVRIIDKISFAKFAKRPKWVIGFSDATVIHLHLNCRLGIASIHSKMCNSFPAETDELVPGQAEAIDSIRKALTGETMTYDAATEAQNRTGTVTGKLVGGNLSIIQMLCGSKSAIKTDNAILFIEDVGEYLYKLDGMMWNLKRGGKLDKLKGLIIGAFKIKPDDTGEEFSLNLHDIVMEKVKEFAYPVCFDFPVGHVYVNDALKCGVHHKLEVSSGRAVLTSLE